MLAEPEILDAEDEYELPPGSTGATIDIEEYLLEFERPFLYEKQFQAIYDERRYSCIEASTKAGKTSGCIVWFTEKALHGKEGHNFWWVAPNSNQADIAFRFSEIHFAKFWSSLAPASRMRLKATFCEITEPIDSTISPNDFPMFATRPL